MGNKNNKYMDQIEIQTMI